MSPAGDTATVVLPSISPPFPYKQVYTSHAAEQSQQCQVHVDLLFC